MKSQMPPKFRDLLKQLNLLRIDDYVFERWLLGGKMSLSAVYVDATGNRRVYKILIGPTEEALARFRREAEYLKDLNERAYAKYHARLASPLKELPNLGVYHFATEYLDGKSVAELMEQARPPWGVERCTDYLLRIAEALKPSTNLGIVHRDLHAGNIMMCDGLRRGTYEEQDFDPGVRILDYGVAARHAWPHVLPKEALTDAFRHLGALSCWSPESLKSPAQVGPAHDVWALGALYYRLLTGSYAFAASDFGEYYRRVSNGDYGPTRLDSPDYVTRMATHLLTRMFTCEPELRVLYGSIVILCGHFLDGTYEILVNNHSHLLPDYFCADGDLVGCLRCQTIVQPSGCMCTSCGQRGQEWEVLRVCLAERWGCARCKRK